MPRFYLRVVGVFLILAAIGPERSAQAQIRDSVEIAIEAHDYRYMSGPYSNCGTWLKGLFPDAGSGGPYTFVTTNPADGPWINSAALTVSNADIGFVIPAGYKGLAIGGSGQQGSTYDGCDYYSTVYSTVAAGFGTWYARWELEEGEPVALFTAELGEGRSVTFDGSFASDQSHEFLSTGKVPVRDYLWDLGNGQTQTSAAFTYVYPEPGSYLVKLTVTDDDDQTDDFETLVEVPASIIEYSMAVSRETVSPGEDFQVEITARNVGSEPIASVTIPQDVAFRPTYPESDYSKSVNATRQALGDVAPLVFSNLGPGEEQTTTQTYKVVTSARATVESKTVAVDVDWEGVVFGVSGSDAGGNPVTVRNGCIDGSCSDKIRVTPATLNVEVTLLGADGEVSEIGSGRRRRKRGNAGWITDHRFLSIEDLRARCIAGCVNVVVSVTDPDGMAVEGAQVKLSATDVAGAAVVTPDQGGGFFCTEDAVDQCAKDFDPQSTDSEGIVRVVYWFPGVIENAATTIKAEVSKADYETANDEKPLGILPTKVEFGTPSVGLSPDDSGALLLSERIKQGTNATLILGEGCKAILKYMLSEPKANIDVAFIDGVSFAATFVCDQVFAKIEDSKNLKLPDWLVLFDTSKKFAELAQINWFLKSFGMPGNGLAQLSVASPQPPFLDVESDFTGAATTSVSKLVENQLSLASFNGSVNLEVHEVSYKKRVGVTSTEVPALYFRFWTDGGAGQPVEHKALIQAGYSPELFLTEKGVRVANISVDALASDASLSLSDASAQQAKTDGGTAVPIDSVFYAGNVLVIDAGTEVEETVQVQSVDPTSVQLTTELRFAHEVGAAVAKIDSLAAAPPPAPHGLRFTSGMPGTSTAPLLEWWSRAPATSYDVELASDSAFATLILDQPAIAADSIQVSGLDDVTRYYWRIRAANNLGTGAWSGTYSFRTGAPLYDDVSQAALVSLPDSGIVAAWVVAATSETLEAQPSCGVGDNSIWTRFVAPSSGSIAVHTVGSTFNTLLSVWTGGQHPMTEVACNDDWDTPDGKHFVQSAVEFDATAGQTYYVRIAGRDGEEGIAQVTLSETLPVSTDDSDRPIPDQFVVEAYPNPLHGDGTIALHQLVQQHVLIEVFDLLGRRRLIVTDEALAPGYHAVPFDASALTAGTYLVRAVSGDRVATTAVTVLW